MCTVVESHHCGRYMGLHDTQCHSHRLVQHGLPVVLLLCIEKWIFPAEISSLGKDGFGKSIFAARSAIQRDGVAQLTQDRLAPALKEPRCFHTSSRDPQKNLHCFFRESLQVNNYPRINLGLPNLHSHF